MQHQILSSMADDHHIDQTVGMVTGEAQWHEIWLFGIVVDDDLNYYVPNDYDTEIPIVPVI